MQQPSVTDLFNQILDPPLWVLTAAHGADRGGLIATFVANASLVPDLPRILAGIARQHHTWSLLQAARCFALHLLDESRLDWVDRFGLRSGRDADKFLGLEWSPGTTGAPLLAAALVGLECRVESAMDTGDRTIYLAEVVRVGPLRAGRPLTVQRMLESLSPQQKAILRGQLHHDTLVDAEAIRAWRSARPKNERLS